MRFRRTRRWSLAAAMLTLILSMSMAGASAAQTGAPEGSG